MDIIILILVGLSVFLSIRAKTAKKKAPPAKRPAADSSNVRTDIPEQIRFSPGEEEHLHPAMAPKHVIEKVPMYGSLAEEAMVQGEMEGCEDLQRIRPVMTQPVRAASRTLSREDVLRGVVMSEVLGKRGGRRAL